MMQFVPYKLYRTICYVGYLGTVAFFGVINWSVGWNWGEFISAVIGLFDESDRRYSTLVATSDVTSWRSLERLTYLLRLPEEKGWERGFGDCGNS